MNRPAGRIPRAAALQPDIRLHIDDAPSPEEEGVRFHVRQALLPVRWWCKVRVLRAVRKDLTIFERYLLEMAIELQTVSSTDVEEVLSLPAQFLSSSVWRLTAAGALRRTGQILRVVPEIAESLIASQALAEQVESTAEFVLLPRTGDLLAVASNRGRNWVQELDRNRRLRRTATAPAPAELWGRRRDEYLAERIEQGKVAGSDERIAGVVVRDSDDPPLLPALSLTPVAAPPGPDDPLALQAVNGSAGGPTARGADAYLCRAVVRDGAVRPRVDAHLIGAPRRPSRGAEAAAERDEGGDDQVTEAVDLTGADGLVKSWEALLDAVGEEANIKAAWRLVTVSGCEFRGARREGPHTWVFDVSAEVALAIAASGQSLISPVGLLIANDETVLELCARLAPVDEAADAVFAADRLVMSLLSAADPATEIELACATVRARHGTPVRDVGTDEYLTVARVRERIWQLGHFRLAYTMRAGEDFFYD